MFNQRIRFHSNGSIDMGLKIFISLVLMITLCPMRIDLQEEVPITVQSLVILMVAIFWGWRIGLVATLTYIAAGIFGWNVFPGYQSGWERIQGEFGGFYFGFVAAALVVGYMAEQEWSRRPFQCLSLWFVGHVIILLLGGFWLRKFNPDFWWDMIVITLPGAAVKSAIGFMFTRVFIRFLFPSSRPGATSQ